MATAASTEASEVRRRGRQRLIGAIVIVLLLVVFIPMLLDSEPRPARTDPALTIPSKDNAPPLPAPAKAPAAAAPSSPASSPPVAASAPPAAAVAPAKAASVEPPKQQGVPAPATAKPATAPKLEGFAVQIGAFRDEEKLKQAREKLAAAGIVHYTERLDASSGALTRLRAGPFPSRAAAEAAAAKVRASGLPEQVVPLP